MQVVDIRGNNFSSKTISLFTQFLNAIFYALQGVYNKEINLGVKIGLGLHHVGRTQQNFGRTSQKRLKFISGEIKDIPH